MHCYTVGKGIETSCLVNSGRSIFLHALKLSLKNSKVMQVRLNTYAGMELNNKTLQDRIASIDWNKAEVNFNESQYDV